METSIPISFLNDFLFCPKSIYFHNLYGRYHASVYHDKPQIEGKIRHENIEEGRYSSAKRYVQALTVFSIDFGLHGKIDILDTETGSLIERKNMIRYLYEGYAMQLYGQYYCLMEMGYDVRSLWLHSLSDNKRYRIPLPRITEERRLRKIITDLAAFDPSDPDFSQKPEKCKHCIYRELCDSSAA